MSNKYLCMSYNKYIILRKKLSNLYSDEPTNDSQRLKLIDHIRSNTDYELKRQCDALNNTTNLEHKKIHSAKIIDLMEQANGVLEQRIIYMKERELSKEQRTNDHVAKSALEKENKELNKKNRIFAIKQLNLARVTEQMAQRDRIRTLRQETRAQVKA